MNKTDLIFFSLLADKRARERGGRFHVVRYQHAIPDLVPILILAEGDRIPQGAVRLYSTAAGRRRRRAYR